MRLARAVERRLERMLDTMAGRVFQGRLHPVEIAQRIIRQADLETTDDGSGPTAANAITVTLNPADIDIAPASLARILTDAYEAQAGEEGWRLPGPTYVGVKLDPSLTTGDVRVHLEMRKGSRHPWGRLTGAPPLELANNRLLVGRGSDCDVAVPHEEVSRRHAEIIRRHGAVWVRDLGSANGTRVDGTSVGGDPVELRPGSVLTLANRSFRFEIA